MLFFLITTLSIIVIIWSKFLLKKWINHLSVYCIIWSVLILLYEWKLLPYVDIIPLAWFFIAASFLSFLFGTLTFITARNLFPRNKILSRESDSTIPIFIDKGKTVKYALLIFSLISLYAGIQNWMVLIHKYGSIPAVFLNAADIYKEITRGGIKGVVPFISNFGYVAIFFSGIYTAFKGKFTLLTFLPFIGIILKELANVGRAGMLIALLEFLFSFILTRHLLNDDSSQRFKFSKKNAIIASSILIIFFVASASFVRISRGSFEHFNGASKLLREQKNNLIFSPSLYLYLSSDVGVLSQYLKSDRERTGFGQNTFLTVYHILDRLDVLKRPSDYQKGYFIPMWTNTGTYIRELHADFGILGPLIGPYLFGFFITLLWFKFFEKKSFIVLTILVYLFLVVGFSFLVMITRSSYWSISQFLIILIIPLLERIASIVHGKSIERQSGRT